MGLLSYKGIILAPYLKVLNLEELTSCLEMILRVLTSLNGWNSEGRGMESKGHARVREGKFSSLLSHALCQKFTSHWMPKLCTHLYEAAKCNGVTCSLCVAALVRAPFLIRNMAENSSPCKIALCSKHWPSISAILTSQPWPTKVFAMLSCCSVSAMCKGTCPLEGSSSFSLPGN